jgi:hypothetical protein
MNAIAIGNYAGQNTQSDQSIAIGWNAGQNLQDNSAVAIGFDSGQNNQNSGAVAIGKYAGQYSQGNQSVAIGIQSGNTSQGTNAISIGNAAGYDSQSELAIGIGQNAGFSNQSTNAIAIGYLAGNNNQGENAIAIGNSAGYSSQGNNSIILNASGNIFNGETSSFYVNPIRSSSSGLNGLMYNTSTCEITYSDAKTFVIDHPKDKNKYLVHACLEGPEGGVYYRGKGEIINNSHVTISLPDYASVFTDFTIQITSIYGADNNNTFVTEVEDNKFNVYGTNRKFYWHVHGKRTNIEVEPDKEVSQVSGSGPYLWINNV